MYGNVFAYLFIATVKLTLVLVVILWQQQETLFVVFILFVFVCGMTLIC